VLAAMTASRKEQRPSLVIESLVVVTVMVASAWTVQVVKNNKISARIRNKLRLGVYIIFLSHPRNVFRGYFCRKRPSRLEDDDAGAVTIRVVVISRFVLERGKSQVVQGESHAADTTLEVVLGDSA